ncbi:hypothetical protein [Spirosoma foliorum]|uniref:Uncharacterized protein n=1 Tax=Spirosoma foliorum TaxID=2710596 RepID=A0A7G5GNY5_9BACT|nr:hypothetical protein [Spirosoma foliorum]QMW00577.1 hypothetical protein H3H32_21550 [Spirosoma foliorum]
MMQKAIRQGFIEISWLILSLGLTMLVARFLFGPTFLTSLDIQLYDTYLVVESWYILVPMFLLVTFMLYFVKEFRNSFRRTYLNWILIITGLALVISLIVLVSAFSQFSGGSLLSESGSDKTPALTQNPMAKMITNFFTAIQLLIISILLFISYRWGVQKRNSSY